MKRVVVGQNSDGVAAVISQDDVSWGDDAGAMRGADLWTSASSPPSLQVGYDPTVDGPSELTPPPGGSAFRIVEFAPKASSGTHATESLDYVVVLSGEVVLEVGGREIALRAGDLLIQAGSEHNWVNRSDKPCVLAAVLLGAGR
jgi:quercetin dioxygenase-like cupin family protein